MKQQHPLMLAFNLLLFLIISLVCSTCYSLKIPRLSPIAEWEKTTTDDDDYSRSDVKTFYYNQTLDHFNYMPQSYQKFQQRYLINFKYWGGANNSSNAPIFAYLGAERPIDNSPKTIGFLTDNAASFNALILYIEHRYYGESVPFGSRKEALKNASTIGYFNSAQALADYAQVIIHIKSKLLQAKNSPVIVIGGSYGGMLATWFRLKYPHLAIGALASSAPILYFDHLTPHSGYFSVASRNFLEPLKQTDDLVSYLESMYASAAQNDRPPDYPVTVICGGIDGISSKESDILSKIYAGVVAFRGNNTCKVNGPVNISETREGWRWQTCSEMVMPIGIGNNTMFEPEPYNYESFERYCKKKFGVTPRPHWVTTYYGGHDLIAWIYWVQRKLIPTGW